MSLVVAPEEYIGRRLLVEPGYGWGWTRRDDLSIRVDYAQVQAQGGFHVRVRYFFTYRGEWKGLVGVVEQAGHSFDGLWIGCTTRLSGNHDFTANLCYNWDLDIGPARPQGEKHWQPVGVPLYSGYGILAEEEACIEAFRVSCRTVAA